ncbi:A/G-specific adenine glycosylase [Patescibacteria group bacterium]|jgi:A/G-specific adenine glycosylase|nr:A/G-specific adenine glycosylase [Patescibacteria group bacterium]
MNWSPLLRWYAREGRNLPWRKTHDAYRILVSEVMLQQTQVSRVLVFYKTWLKKFPTWHALARASNAEVIHAWAGLGYNRRGLMLRDIAKQVVTKGLPKSREEWLALKGVGPYTSAALTAFSLREPAIPIDTNIRRVLGRIFLGKPFPLLKDDGRIERLAWKTWPKGAHAPEVPQALFDLAVAICKKDPDCAACPLRDQCPASKKFLSGRVRIPKRTIKTANETRHRNKPYPDRIYRGRILAEARAAKHPLISALGPKIDQSFDPQQDSAWLDRMILRLERDGLIRRIDKKRISV